MRYSVVVFRALVLACCGWLIGTATPAFANADSVRVKDLGKLKGWRENGLVGYGIVTGLAGTGDSYSNRVTHQALSNLYAQFHLSVPVDDIQSRNVAVVMVTAQLPAFAQEGDSFDITVTSAGDARSLVGGSLLMTPLQGPDGNVYALAQGSLSVGGYRYDANGNVVQKNHPTVGSVPNGATAEASVNTQIVSKSNSVTFVLAQPDYTTAQRVADAINTQFAGAAEARDASNIEVHIPGNSQAKPVAFLAKLENVQVQPDRRALVVINERTGTVVAGGDVRIASVAISQGDLKISISEENTASQPIVIGRGNTGVNSLVVTNTQVDVHEHAEPGYVSNGPGTVGDLVQALTRMRTNTRDIISVLRAVKAAGALHADLIVQ